MIRFFLGVLLLLPTGSVHGQSLAEAARMQIGVTTHYDPAYVALTYPGGDVPVAGGVCTDVVVRALRLARGMDLQQLIHEDMKACFVEYPKMWGLSKPDKNIDHRRVPNMQTYFKRMGWSLPVTANPHDYLMDDIVTCLLPGNLPHIMIVSEKAGASGVPLVVHNIGQGAREEDMLFAYPTTGHYRLPKAAGACR